MPSALWDLTLSFNKPSFPFSAIEFSVYGLAIFVFLHAKRQGKSWVSTLLWGMVFGFLVEHFIASTQSREPGHTYYTYGPFMIMLGAPWRQVPLWLGVGWGTIAYACTWTAQQMKFHPIWRALAAGLLAVNIDLSVDPMAQLEKYWVWTQPNSDQGYFGVPFDNFLGWMTIVATYAFCTRWGIRKLGGDDPPAKRKLVADLLPAPVAALFALALTILAGGLVEVAYGRIARGTVFVIIFAIAGGVTLAYGLRSNRDQQRDWSILAVPLFMHLFCMFILFVSGKLQDQESLVIVLPINAIVGFVGFAWVSLDNVVPEKVLRFARIKYSEHATPSPSAARIALAAPSASSIPPSSSGPHLKGEAAEGSRIRALVLSGGAVKGAYEAGAASYLIKKYGNDYDVICGISVGGINGAFLAQFKKGDVSAADELLKLWGSVNNDKVKRSWFPFGVISALWEPSVYDSSPLRKWIEGGLDTRKIRASGRKLRIVSVSWDSGESKTVDENNDRLADWVLASASYPILLSPTKIDGQLWSDGGLRSVTPLGKAIELGATDIDVIMCSDPFAKDPFDAAGKSAIPSLLLRALDIQSDEIMRRDLEICGLKNDAAGRGEGYRHVKLRLLRPSESLTPDPLNFDPELIQKMIRIGKADAEKAYEAESHDEIRRWTAPEEREAS